MLRSLTRVRRAPRSPLRRGAARLAVRCAAPGLTVVDAALAPRTLPLRDDQVDHYLDEIAASAAVSERWAKQRGRVRWQETYAKAARLALTLGDAGDATAWTCALGRGDELLPATPRASVRTGSAFALRLLADGRPVAGVAVGMRAAGATRSTFVVTDVDGTARFMRGGAGAVVFHATRLESAPDGAWRSRFVTLAFDVGPP